ncbi:hypothetical protein Pint_10343 [Pistacia integerrima]|uniref:Uncharacterized protein n=1 Tax=Pistacia integerrima TaxID=434235 RepID=A0ACC0XKG2_9ROSI|nr:hypothetical protein Pint_10343 [Pistacia integerrima]
MAKKQQCVESQDQIQTNDTKGEDDIEEVLKEFMEMRVLTQSMERKSEAGPRQMQSKQLKILSRLNLYPRLI